MDYALLARQMRALLEDETDTVACLANASALLNASLGGIQNDDKHQHHQIHM